MALVLTKFAGAQAPYLCEVDSTSSGFTTSSSVARGNQTYSYLMDASGDAIDLDVTTNTYVVYVGFAIYFETSVPTSTTLGYYDSTTGGHIACEFWLNSSGQLEFREGDSGGSTALATTSALSANTWYYVEVAFENRNTAGDWYFYVDDVEIGSGTANGNFGSGGVTSRMRWFQGSTYNRYMTDMYVGYDNATTVDESQRLGGLTKVVYYWSTAATSTSSSGVNLDIGTWSACCSNTLSPSVAAEVTGTGNARRLLDTGTDGTYTGPYNQFGTLADCKGYKVTCMAERSGGGGSNHYIDLGGTSAYNLSQVVTLDTSPVYVQAYYNSADPGIGTGAIGVGFGTDGGQDFECYNIQAAVLHAERSATARNVVQNPANPGDLSRMSFTENQATVTTSSPRNVTCTTEVISWDGTNHDAQIGFGRSFTAAKGTIKRRKGLVFQEHYFDASSYQRSHSGNSSTNAFDGDTGTYAETNFIQLGANFPVGRGLSAQIGPVEDPSEQPIRVEARFYVSNTAVTTGECTLYAYFGDETDFDFSGDTTDEYFPTKGMSEVVAYGDSGSGSWSPWGEVRTGNYAWDAPHSNNATEPLSWDAIRTRLALGFGRTNGATGRVHAIQIRITSAVATLRTGYFDGSGTADSGISAGANWSNKTNAADGSTSTWCTNSGFVENSSVTVHGNTLTQGSADSEIYAVYVRAYCRFTWTTTDYAHARLNPGFFDTPYGGSAIDKVEKYSVGGEYFPEYFVNENVVDNNNIVKVPTSGSGFWTPWYRLDPNDPDYAEFMNWTDISGMSLSFSRDNSFNHAATELAVAKMEIAVLSPPTNANRAGGRAKKNRGAIGSTQANTFTESAAAIKIDRGVNCTTEAISFTESAATVSFATHRTVTCSPEALQLAEVASTINASRVTSGVTEVLSSTSAGTVVDTARGVAGTTQALAFAEQQSTVNVARGVISGTEALSMASTGAINRERGVVGATESVLATESQASISTTANLDVTCTTEAITFTETPASVNGTRIAAGTVEITAFVENASAVNAERIVTATTETLALTDNDSTVAFGRIVAATTESISLVEGSATANRQRGVNAGTEALSLTETSANVAANRGVISATEVLALADNDSVTNRARNTIGVTESVTISENASVVDRQRGVNAGTEAVTMTESLSTVTRGANLDVTCTTEAISFTEATATLGLDRGVAASTEALSLTEGAASVTRSYLVTGSTEVLNLSENAATIDITANNRDVTCTTEAIAFTESQATVAFPRNVSATTEALAFAESAAGVNGQRIVGATVELTAMAESAASVNLSRTVTSQTDQLVMAESAANVSTSTNRIVNATTEQLSVQESSATSNQTRNVLSSTEVLGLTENPSSIQVVRNVVATTEVLSFAEAAASPNLTRDVIGLSAAALLVESSAQVFRGANLDVTGLTAAMTLLESAATATFPRRVDGTTEALLFTEFPALANFPKLVSALTAPLTFTEAQATISKLPASVQPGSMIWVDPGVEGAIFTDNLVIQRYD